MFIEILNINKKANYINKFNLQAIALVGWLFVC